MVFPREREPSGTNTTADDPLARDNGACLMFVHALASRASWTLLTPPTCRSVSSHRRHLQFPSFPMGPHGLAWHHSIVRNIIRIFLLLLIIASVRL